MATYTFSEFPGVGLVDPTIKAVYTTMEPDAHATKTVRCEVIFNQLEGEIGNKRVLLGHVPVSNLNGDDGNIEDRIWSYLNAPVNGHIQA